MSLFTSSIPPISFHSVLGASTDISRIAEGLTDLRAMAKSFFPIFKLSKISWGISSSSYLSSLNLWMFLFRTSMAASFAREARSAPTNPCVFEDSSSRLTDFVRGIPLVWIFNISSLLFLSGIDIRTSLSKRPALRSAGSIESGRFVAAITTTFPLDFRPSIIVSNCETTLLSTSPCESSRFGAIASISSMKIIDGAFFSASSKISLIFFSDPPRSAL